MVNGHVTEVAILMEGEWSCYRSGHFIGGSMVMLWMRSVLWRENGHFTEVLTFMDICIFYCILWSIGGALFLVCSISYLQISSSSSSSSSMFSSTQQIFLHTGEREDCMPAKIEQVCQSGKGK